MLLSRYLHTIRYLKPIQIRYQLWYRIRSKKKLAQRIQNHVDSIPKTNNLSFNLWIDKPDSYNNSIFTFLNQSHQFENNIDWDYNKNGKLWTYNLNYMDYLLQDKFRKEEGLNLMGMFINGYGFNNNGKEPYPISLRAINWIKFISKHKVHNKSIIDSLNRQYSLLFNSLEYHLLGNHLLENGFSLLFGAFYFKNSKYYNKAKEIITKELNEQILPDGGHFELSPMYHQIILDRLLDSINLIQNNQQFDDQNKLLNFLENKTSAMLSWLNHMTFKNGDIPHLNDSAFGIAPSTEQLFDYAKRLNLPVRRSLGEGGNLNLSTSGYRRFNNRNCECIVDIGQLGPNYIPGHAHADMLNFVMYIDEKPFIIDMGISTYEKNKRRQLERSTFSHNTVTVDNDNQSDVWGGFRVGKRAKIQILKDESIIVEAEHNGYKPVIHKRSFEFNQNEVTILDTLSKDSDNAVAGFFFHPEQSLIKNKESIIINNKYSIHFSNSTNIKLEEYDYPKGYNTYSKSTKCLVTFNNSLKTKIITQ
jgi:hypothetical protein